MSAGSRRKGAFNPFDERGLLARRRDRKASEGFVNVEPNVGEESFGVFVKMQKGLGLSVEDARSLFDDPFNGTKSIKQWRQPHQGLGRRVFHRGECSAPIPEMRVRTVL
jgi:hypothetical protein